MKNKLILLNILVLNFLLWYFIIRISGDVHLNTFLDALIDFVISNVPKVIIFVMGVFVPLDKVKEMTKLK